MDCIVHGVTESDSAERLSLAAAACLISRPYLHLSQEGHLMKGIRVSLGLNTFLYRVLVRCNSHIIQFTQESVQLNGTYYIHRVMQSSLQKILKHLYYLPKETSYL